MKQSNNKKWTTVLDKIYLQDISQQRDALPVGVYLLKVDGFHNFYLTKQSDKFEFPYKVYGVNEPFINRVKKTYDNTTGNLGVLLNGIKSTGKTVTAEKICNTMNMPVIVINHKFEEDLTAYIASIPSDVIIFIDEYEKIFDDYSSEVLTIMDGVMNGVSRKIFILTTNKLSINDNMLQRPSRIRYIKTFSDLEIEVIEEIVDDLLEYTQFREQLLNCISELSIITIDIVKSLIQEVNIHEESPENFMHIFNTKGLDNPVNIIDITGESRKVLEENANIRPSTFNSSMVNTYISVNGNYNFQIKRVIDENTVVVIDRTLDEEEATADNPITKTIVIESSVIKHSVFTRSNVNLLT